MAEDCQINKRSSCLLATISEPAAELCHFKKHWNSEILAPGQRQAEAKDINNL